MGKSPATATVMTTAKPHLAWKRLCRLGWARTSCARGGRRQRRLAAGKRRRYLGREGQPRCSEGLSLRRRLARFNQLLHFSDCDFAGRSTKGVEIPRCRPKHQVPVGVPLPRLDYCKVAYKTHYSASAKRPSPLHIPTIDRLFHDVVPPIKISRFPRVRVRQSATHCQLLTHRGLLGTSTDLSELYLIAAPPSCKHCYRLLTAHCGDRHE